MWCCSASPLLPAPRRRAERHRGCCTPARWGLGNLKCASVPSSQMGTTIVLLFRINLKMNGSASGTSSEVSDTCFQFSPPFLLSPVNQRVLTHQLFLTRSSLHVTVFCSVAGQHPERPLVCPPFENKTATVPGSTNDTLLMFLSLVRHIRVAKCCCSEFCMS